jgi:hypothetical protein
VDRRTSLRLLAGAGAALKLEGKAADFSFRSEPGKVRVLLAGKPYTTFYYGAEWDRPYLHPLVTPSGVEISRAIPPKPHEDQDHAWHRGLWYGHGDISGADFWRERADKVTARKTTGRMVVATAPVVDDQAAAITARTDLTTAAGEVIGGVIERFAFSRAPERNVIDVTITISADKGRDLVMGDTDDGGLAIRLTEAFKEDKGAVLVNSEGLKGTAQIWGKAARWVDYSASMDGRIVGAAILDHPKNFRYPTQWHARGYGLNSANPFAAGSFSKQKDPKMEGQWTIKDGTKLAFQYRVVLHDGDAAKAGFSW